MRKRDIIIFTVVIAGIIIFTVVIAGLVAVTAWVIISILQHGC